MNRIKQLREERDIKQRELAKLLGVEISAISKLELGRVPLRDEYIIKLARFFNVSTNYLLGMETDTKRLLPVLGTVKAGYNYLAQENIIDYIDPSTNITDPENYFGLVVKGDSMAPLFDEGDYLIVHKNDGEFDSNDICIVLIDGEEATVKKVVKTNDGIELHACNPYYPVKKFNAEEIKNLPVNVIGTVIRLIRNFK